MDNISHNPVSADTLFHFTGKEKGKENLLSILKNGFYPRYCIEDLSSYIKNEELQFTAFPMVCFCDIPLTRIKTHTEHYDEYAIGLNKEWGINRLGVTPISYIHDSSMLFNYLSIAYKNINYINTQVIKLNKKQKNFKNLVNNPYYQVESNLVNIFPYLKLYKGLQWDKDKQEFNKIVFYNEREWRYIPDITLDDYFNDDLRVFLPKKEYENLSLLKEYNTKLEKKKLDFDPKDINFIIVPQDNDIPEMVDKVEEIMKNKNEPDDKQIKILITKIISMKQIRENF